MKPHITSTTGHNLMRSESLNEDTLRVSINTVKQFDCFNSVEEKRDGPTTTSPHPCKTQLRFAKCSISTVLQNWSRR